MAEKRGCPLKPAADRKTASLKFRCRPATHDQVRAMAEATGRSASEMVEHIIERYFAEDRMRVIAREEIELARLEELAEAAPERTTGYLREALKDYEPGGKQMTDAERAVENARPRAVNVMPSAHGYKPL